MLFPRGQNKGDRSLDERWVEKGRQAKETTMSLDEWSDREIGRWDLDTDSRRPTGEQNFRTWEYRKPHDEVLEGEPGDERPDIRERYNR